MPTLPLILAVLAQTPQISATATAVPAGSELQAAVSARSSDFFRIFFDECDPGRLATFYSPDFEFYHDRSGRSIGGDTEVRMYRERCTARSRPGATASRRELVPGSQKIFSVPGFGAIEEGEHLFYTRPPNEPERLTSRGRFLQIWELRPAGWQLTRVVSYAHERASVPPAPR
jgi:hypothetical protein